MDELLTFEGMSKIFLLMQMFTDLALTKEEPKEIIQEIHSKILELRELTNLTATVTNMEFLEDDDTTAGEHHPMQKLKREP
jgi:hypothetical protein